MSELDDDIEKTNFVDIKLNLTRDELHQFYWAIYGASLIEFKSTPKAKEAHLQIVEQIESFLIREDADNIFRISKVKELVKKSINKRKDCN